MIAWANLLGAIVQTMIKHDIGNDAIHDQFDNMDIANPGAFRGGTRDFAFFVTAQLHRLVASN